MNYRQLYEWGKRNLEKAQINDADYDARFLMETLLGVDRNSLLLHGDVQADESKEEIYKSYIQKRMTHIPLQHLTGVQNFMGLDFMVNENVLIPRQDTEILVEEIMKDLHDGMRILDMCTGSGCILLSLLKYSNDTTGVGIDLSPKALEVAGQNAINLSLKERASFIQSNLFENVDEKFDLIVSNPPYIEKKVIETLMPEVKDHEPMMALDGGEDGLFFYRKITEEAGEYLKRGSSLFFEIGFDQAAMVSTLMEQNGYREITVVKDYAGLDRVVYGTYMR